MLFLVRMNLGDSMGIFYGFLACYLIEPVLYIVMAFLDFLVNDDYDILEYRDMFLISWSISFFSIWFIAFIVACLLFKFLYDSIAEKLVDTLEEIHNLLQKCLKKS